MQSEEQFDREQESIDAAYARHEMSPEEYRRWSRELRLDYEAMAEEAAQKAYLQELDRW